MKRLMMVSLLMLSACGPSGSGRVPDELRGRWDVQQVGGASLGEAVHTYLDIDPSAATLRGWSGCRGIAAPLSSFGGSLSIGAISQSAGSCQSAAAATDETRLFAVLPHVQRYILHGRRLELLPAEAGSEALVLLRKSDEAPE